MMAPVVHGLEAKYWEQVNFVYLDIDDAGTSSFKQQLESRLQPHFYLLDGEGSILQQWIGVVDGAELEDALVAVIQ